MLQRLLARVCGGLGVGRHQLAILHLVQALPVTTLIALHDLNQALTCDRVAVLDKGRLLAHGTTTCLIFES